VDTGCGRSRPIYADIVLTTPLTNVLEIRDRSGPVQGAAVPLLLIGAAFLAGMVASAYGIFAPDVGPAVRVGFGGMALLTGGLAFSIGGEGLYRLVGQTKETIRYRAPPPDGVP
jgi:hypothetical protein